MELFTETKDTLEQNQKVLGTINRAVDKHLLGMSDFLRNKQINSKKCSK